MHAKRTREVGGSGRRRRRKRETIQRRGARGNGWRSDEPRGMTGIECHFNDRRGECARSRGRHAVHLSLFVYQDSTQAALGTEAFGERKRERRTKKQGTGRQGHKRTGKQKGEALRRDAFFLFTFVAALCLCGCDRRGSAPALTNTLRGWCAIQWMQTPDATRVTVDEA